MRQDLIEIAGLAVCIGTFLVANAADTSQPREGEWRMSNRHSDSVRLELTRGTPMSHWQWSTDHPIADLHGLSADQLRSGHSKVKFSLDRDAGSFVLEGDLYYGAGGGKFSFVPNASFVRQLRDLGYEGGADEDLFGFAVRDISVAYARAVKKSGLRRVKISDLSRLRDHGVDLDWLSDITSSGFKELEVEEAVRLKDHGVSAKLMRALKQYGLDRITPDDAVKLHDHGVSPDYIAAISKSGFSKVTAEEMVKLHDHGVGERLLVGVNGSRTADEVIRLQDHGIGPDYLAALNSAMGQVRTEDIVRLHDNGIDAQYIARLRNSGFQKLSVEQIIKLRQHGVD